MTQPIARVSTARDAYIEVCRQGQVMWGNAPDGGYLVARLENASAFISTSYSPFNLETFIQASHDALEPTDVLLVLLTENVLALLHCTWFASYDSAMNTARQRNEPNFFDLKNNDIVSVTKH